MAGKAGLNHASQAEREQLILKITDRADDDEQQHQPERDRQADAEPAYGCLHRRFDPNSTSRKARNGVGVSADGRTVYFAITYDVSNFHSCATLFQRQLGTPNALFLEGGSVPQMWATGGLTRLSFAPVGPIIAVVEKQTPSVGR